MRPYSEEHKAKTAWEEYDKARHKTAELAPLARQKMQRSAESAETLSIPVPEGEPLHTKDTNKALLTATERTRLQGLLDRAEKAGRGPFKQSPTEVLQREYERGLREGGPSGGAVVRAVYELCRDFGYDLDGIVDTHRQKRHREWLKDAASKRQQALLVGGQVPQPPFPHPNEPRQASSVGTYGARGNPFLPGAAGPQGTPFPKKRRRPAWK